MKVVFKTGQIVRINTNYYRRENKRGERYQKIVMITKWPISDYPGQCLHFANGDQCHQNFASPLTKRERG
jgi:hypothetical protein